MAMAGRLRIAVVGAGVAGSILARALAAREDVELLCLERAADAGHSESGTGLNIGPNALKSLASLDPGLAAELVRHSLPWRSWTVSLVDGTPLLDIPLARVADAPGIRIRWAELYRLLRAPLEERIAYRAEVTGARYAADGRVVLALRSNGSAMEVGSFDLVAACDGRYSVLREQLAGKPAVRHFGVANARILARHGGGPVDDLELWFNGPQRLLAFRLPDDLLYVSATFPLDARAEIPEGLKRPANLRALYTPADRRLGEKARYVVDSLCAAPQCHFARLQEADTLFHDPGGRVLFLGDAAHPILPTLGQGATQAFEDAVATVDELLRALDAGGFSAQAFTAALARRRAERVEFVKDFSREASDTLLPGSDPVAGTRAKAAPAFLAKLDRMYRDCSLAAR